MEFFVLVRACLCVIVSFRLHQQEERTEEEKGVVLRGAASSCHHSVFLW